MLTDKLNDAIVVTGLDWTTVHCGSCCSHCEEHGGAANTALTQRRVVLQRTSTQSAHCALSRGRTLRACD